MTERILPTILKVETVAKSRIFEVQAVDLRFSNGEERTFERLTPQRGSSVLILPIHQNELILIKEYAVGSEGETPEQSANRELQEEIGFGAKKLHFLRSLYSSPSHMYGLMHVFIAQDLYPSQLEGDEPEPLEIVRLPLSEIDRLLADPNFAESRYLSALFMLREFLCSH